jgi:hypothetical protein
MKKILLALAFAVAYAIFLGLGLECLLNLFGISMGIALDGSSVAEQYPRFIPFCLTVGFFALAALIGIFILNFKSSEKYEFTKKIWYVQMLIAVAVSVPMIKPWEMLFDFLQKTL